MMRGFWPCSLTMGISTVSTCGQHTGSMRVFWEGMKGSKARQEIGQGAWDHAASQPGMVELNITVRSAARPFAATNLQHHK